MAAALEEDQRDCSMCACNTASRAAQIMIVMYGQRSANSQMTAGLSIVILTAPRGKASHKYQIFALLATNRI